MKFVCENCKAKYQISDDKVAGRTLRMKCRRCGEMIQVAATVTESSVSTKLPGEHAAGSAPQPVRATPPPRPVGPEPLEPSGPDGTGDDGATVIRQSPFFHPSPKAPAPAAPPPPRPGAPRIVPPARASLAGSRSSHPPPRPSNPGPAPMHSPSSPGLHAGFARAVAAPARGAPDAHPAPSQALPTEDWYVGIGGVPLGPVRLAVLRDKAAAGQVDGDSLVWREGFDEWQSVRSIPPLMTVVDEAKQTRASRMSLPAVLPPTPRPSLASAPPSPSYPVAAAAAPVPAPAPSFGAMPTSAPQPASSLPFDLVRSSSLPAAAAPSHAGAPSQTGVSPPAPFSIGGGDPFAPATNGATNGHGATKGANGFHTPGPAAAGAGAAAARISVVPAPITELSPTSVSPSKKRGGLPAAAWALIAMAAAFGGVAAWALFLRQPPADQTVAPTATQAPTEQQLGAAPPPPPTVDAQGNPVPQPEASSATGPAAGPGGVVRGPGGAPAPGKSAEQTTIDNTGFRPTPGGPSAGDPPPSGGGALSEGEINGVVSRNKPIITRRCWLPAYDARASNAPSSAKVSVSLKVGPSGSVTSASAGGSEQHYPGLASCVAGSVKGWQFPPSDEGATINIPFSFSGQ